MRLIVISLLAMFLAVSPALATPQEDYNKGLSAYKDGNYKQAVKWYRQAAEQGDADAQFSLGFMYEYGQGVAQDYKQTAKWYREAAEQGHAFAQFDIGWMYEDGKGVAQDYETAIKWYRQAAEQGFADAQYHLGMMYSFGLGVIGNYQTAYMFYLLALANVEDESEREKTEKIVTSMESLLTPAQKQSAQNDAAEFQAKIDARQ